MSVKENLNTVADVKDCSVVGNSNTNEAASSSGTQANDNDRNVTNGILTQIAGDVREIKLSLQKFFEERTLFNNLMTKMEPSSYISPLNYPGYVIVENLNNANVSSNDSGVGISLTDETDDSSDLMSVSDSKAEEYASGNVQYQDDNLKQLAEAAAMRYTTEGSSDLDLSEDRRNNSERAGKSTYLTQPLFSVDCGSQIVPALCTHKDDEHSSSNGIHYHTYNVNQYKEAITDGREEEMKITGSYLPKADVNCSERGRQRKSPIQYRSNLEHQQQSDGFYNWESSSQKCNNQRSSVALHSKSHAQRKRKVCDERTVSNKKNKLLRCRFCERTFPTPHQVTSHERIHTGDRPYTCYVCQVKFAHGGNMIKHIKSKHPGNNPYKCRHCSRVFETHQSIQSHRKACLQHNQNSHSSAPESFYPAITIIPKNAGGNGTIKDIVLYEPRSGLNTPDTLTASSESENEEENQNSTFLATHTKLNCVGDILRAVDDSISDAQSGKCNSSLSGSASSCPISSFQTARQTNVDLSSVKTERDAFEKKYSADGNGHIFDVHPEKQCKLIFIKSEPD